MRSSLQTHMLVAALAGLAAPAVAGPSPGRRGLLQLTGRDDFEDNAAWAKDLRLNGPRYAAPQAKPKRKASDAKKARRRNETRGRKAARK